MVESTNSELEHQEFSFENSKEASEKTKNIIIANEKSRKEKPDIYPDRFPVPDEFVSWETPYEEYAPETFTAQVVFDNEGIWADPENINEVKRDVLSYEGTIKTDENNYPLNPKGRTGLRGRGLLGKWGPNHAADPIVTRINPETNAVEAILIVRDNGEHAIPGGMVDAGEKVSATLSRELDEETGAKFSFDNAKTLYKGYVDDPRNTDNAWMETTVSHINFESGEEVPLKAGSDARNVAWVELNEETLSSLYASHADFLRLAVENLEQD